MAVVVLALLAGGCGGGPPGDADYAAKVSGERAIKDAALMSSGDPIPVARHAEFLPLAYFPIDPAYNVAAVLKPIDDRTVLQMPTSSGTPRDMRRVGSLEFTLKTQPLKLTAFAEVGATDLTHLFVPFSDMTSGTETYAAGRYLDLTRNATGIYELDFNRAYHPYCYYNPTWECPYPPPENRLKIPVHSGERMKKPAADGPR